MVRTNQKPNRNGNAVHVRTTQPTTLPVPLNDCKSYSYITTTDDDSMLQRLILEAAAFLEDRYKCSIMRSTWKLVCDGWQDPRYWIGNAIQIARPPFGAVASITYLDTNGDSQTLASSQYRVATDGVYGRIVPAKNVTWPTTYEVIQDITITHTAGYASQSDVPYVVRQAVKDCVDYWYNHRGTGFDQNTIIGRGILPQLDAEMGCVGAQVAYA